MKRLRTTSDILIVTLSSAVIILAALFLFVMIFTTREANRASTTCVLEDSLALDGSQTVIAFSENNEIYAFEYITRSNIDTTDLTTADLENMKVNAPDGTAIEVDNMYLVVTITMPFEQMHPDLEHQSPHEFKAEFESIGFICE